MLTHLQISNVVLIEKLNLEFGRGLNVLTGETGAGKSILMDALSLALGARGDAGFVRHGATMATATAEFDSVPGAVESILAENGIDCDDNLILRRTLSSDGKSRAWVNDTPVSIKVLKSIGDALVEIHGQFANHTLLDAATHRTTLDAFAITTNPAFGDMLASTADAYRQYHTSLVRLNELKDMVARSASEREFLEHNVAELRALNVQIGEEQELATRRADMMNAEKNAAILNDALDAIGGRGDTIDAQIFNVIHILQRIKTEPNPYAELIDKLYTAAETVSDVAASITPPTTDIDSIDSIEERLFAIRAAARKHHVTADELPTKLSQMEQNLGIIDNSDAEIKKLEQSVAQYRTTFDNLAKQLSAARRTASDELRKKLLAELPDLKLGSADFMVEQTPVAPGPHGIDDITFMIKTNPGAPFAPLHKSASGGELARLMLAMRVVLRGGADISHTFVFDEVDTGISGATASAVGARLNKLASESQALVITHSAQVAGFADKHFKISKHVENDTTKTTVDEISGDNRINEIARIISGAEITPESIATAKTLIK